MTTGCAWVLLGPGRGAGSSLILADSSHAPCAARYPATTDIDYKMMIGYGANGDRYENWLLNLTPTRDTQQPFVGVVRQPSPG